VRRWRAHEFRRVLAAEAVSNFGAMLSWVAIPWLATLSLDASPLAMGALIMADVAAGTVAALFLGTLIDRSGKRAAAGPRQCAPSLRTCTMDSPRSPRRRCCAC